MIIQAVKCGRGVNMVICGDGCNNTIICPRLPPLRLHGTD